MVRPGRAMMRLAYCACRSSQLIAANRHILSNLCCPGTPAYSLTTPHADQGPSRGCATVKTLLRICSELGCVVAISDRLLQRPLSQPLTGLMHRARPGQKIL